MQLTTTFIHILGQVLAAHRKALPLNQEELAEHIDIHPSALSRIEGGDTPASVRLLRAMAPKLGTKASNLLQDAERVEAHLHRKGLRVTEKHGRNMDQSELYRQVKLVLRRLKRIH